MRKLAALLIAVGALGVGACGYHPAPAPNPAQAGPCAPYGPYGEPNLNTCSFLTGPEPPHGGWSGPVQGPEPRYCPAQSNGSEFVLDCDLYPGVQLRGARPGHVVRMTHDDYHWYVIEVG